MHSIYQSALCSGHLHSSIGATLVPKMDVFLGGKSKWPLGFDPTLLILEFFKALFCKYALFSLFCNGFFYWRWPHPLSGHFVQNLGPKYTVKNTKHLQFFLDSPQSVLLDRVECVRVVRPCMCIAALETGSTKADKQPIDALHCDSIMHSVPKCTEIKPIAWLFSIGSSSHTLM